MKTTIRNIFAAILASLARSIVHKHKPIVIMVTGSVGKTSTKDAVAAALSEKFYLRKSEKSFNSEFGVPLTIIGSENPWSNPLAWLKVFRTALAVIFLPTHYPKMLVLEVGADSPGDLAKILKIVKPDGVVVTLLPSVPVHVEAYETPAAVREEEFSPVLTLEPNAPLIICADDEFAVAKAKRIDREAYNYGFKENSNVQIKDMKVWMETDAQENTVVAGMMATLCIAGQQYPLKIRGAIGRSQLFAPAAAVATGRMFGMTPAEALEGLASYVPPPGRGRVFKGKKDTVLIDDTYNSSPAAVEEILRSLEMIPDTLFAGGRSRKIAVLGDMLELGRYSVAEHVHIGHIAKQTVDVLVTVGPRAKAIGEAALEDGMRHSAVHHFASSVEAVPYIETLIESKDVILVKGSQGVRMERIVRPLLADFADVPELVRQSPEWLKR
jgi:UDP-N-acetylmuramoyl-tripeptide--D-alanyl-D-alanine ligase